MVARHTQRGKRAYRPRVKRSPQAKTRAEKVLSAIPCGMVLGAMVCGVAHLVKCCFTFSPPKVDANELPPRKMKSSKRVRFEGIDEDDGSPSAPASSLANSSKISPGTHKSSDTTSRRVAPLYLTSSSTVDELPIARATTNKRHERISKVHNGDKSLSTTSCVSDSPSSTAPSGEKTVAMPSNNAVQEAARLTRTIRPVKAVNNLRSAVENDSSAISCRYRSRNPDYPNIIVTAPSSPAPADMIELARHMQHRETVRDENDELRSDLAVQRKLKASHKIDQSAPGLVRAGADCFKDESKRVLARTPYPERPKTMAETDDEDCISLLSLSD